MKRGNQTDRAIRHRLSDIDPATRRGVCSICGPIRVARNGKYWLCSVKKADLRASWYNRNQRHSKPSPHKLSQKDTLTRLGICPIDGPVEIVPFARGWACAIRAAELGGHRAEPARKCSMCGKYDSRHNPVSPTEQQLEMCAGCRRLTHNGPLPRTEEQTEPMILGSAFDRSADAHGNIGAHLVVDFEWMNADYMPDYESAVPGWKTIGAKK